MTITQWIISGLLVLLVVLALAMIVRPGHMQVTHSVFSDFMQRITILGLSVAVIFLGWKWLSARAQYIEPSPGPGLHQPGDPSIIETPESPVAGTVGDLRPGGRSAGLSGKNESDIWRTILWINICLAIPWVTAFITRHILALRSNAASFALLALYTIVDIVAGMLLASISFVGLRGAGSMVGILVLALGYNYWSCELIARLWLGAVKGGKRA